MEIKSVSEAIDIIADFLEELDEEYGLPTLKYGDDARTAIKFLHMWNLIHYGSNEV